MEYMMHIQCILSMDGLHIQGVPRMYSVGIGGYYIM